MHPWLYRFAFPGFAEIEWVLPRDVAHDEPWYEPLPWSLACQDLLTWSLDPKLEPTLRALHEATFGDALEDAPGVPFHHLVAPLRGAFERGELVAWALRASSVSSPAILPAEKPKPKPRPTTTTWIEIVLLDDDKQPVPRERYRLTLPDGSTRDGTLDDQGFARVDGIESGVCDVTFPGIDGREWGRAAR